MKMTKALGLLQIALTVFAGLLSRPAVADGDIRSIEVVKDDPSMVARVYPNDADPAVAGETIKFKVRLMNRSWMETYLDSTKIHTWGIAHVGSGSETFDLAYPPQLGLWISGRLRYADLDRANGVKQVGLHYTELTYVYRVMPGDLAMPLKLANESGTGEAMEGASATYYVANKSLWWIKDDLGNSCEFYFGPTSLTPTTHPGWTADGEVRDYDLSKAGIYIRAVDFDTQYKDAANGIWREIAAGSTSASPGQPALSIPGGVTNTVDLYVWTADEAVAVMANGTESKYVVREAGALKTNTVSKIRLLPGVETVPFKIKAQLGSVGQTTQVYLSASPTNRYDAGGARVVDFTSRTIRVGEPMAPTITLTIDHPTIVADTNYPAAKASLNVSLTQAYSNDFYVTVTPSMLSGSGTNPFTNFIGVAETDADNVYLQAATQVLIPAGETEPDKPLYIYALGANDDTASLSKGIVFKATVADPTARAFFTGTPVDAVLRIQASKPVVTVPDAPYTAIPGGVEREFTLHVDDSFRGLSGAYTVYWCNEGGVFEAIPGVVPQANGEMTVLRKYPGQAGGKTYLSSVYIVNADGAGEKSATVQFEVGTTAPKTVQGETLDLRKKFAEGETAEITVKFSEAFTAQDVGYVFLVPRNEASADLVSSASFEETPLVIISGDSETTTTAILDLNDGCAASAALQYDVVVRSEPSLTEGHEIAGWSSKPVTLTVTNLAPNVTQVAMGGWVLEDNGATIGATAAKGVRKMFSAETDEPSILDLEADPADAAQAFLTEWTFYDGAMATKTNVYGSPFGMEVPYTFKNAGLNKVTVRMQDKDMRASKKFGTVFTFYVNTLDTPAVMLEPFNGTTQFNEDDTGASRGRIDVKLSTPPTEPLTVRIEVARKGADNGNYPVPVLSRYYVNFASGVTDGSFYLSEMDGTARSASQGFRFNASVTNETVNPDGVKWCDLYLPVTDFEIMIQNLPPEIQGIADTNAVQVGMNVPFTIPFAVSDVIPDMAAGLTVKWLTSEGVSSESTAVAPDEETLYEGVFTNTFTSAGLKTVTLTVSDKDGGRDSRMYYFYVAPSKSVLLFPHGPHGAGQSELASLYVEAAGRGAGRVWADGALSSVTGFRHLWNYAPEASDATVYARGYAAGVTDDGHLAGMGGGVDIALDEYGASFRDNTPPAGARFWKNTSYGLNVYDSFFYTWILNTRDENGGAYVGAQLGGLQPELVTTTTAEGRLVALPEHDAESVSYPNTVLEAVFSRELRPNDNVGDINADGIPDWFAAHKWSGADNWLYVLVGGDLATGGDLKNVSTYNGDEDYLPAATINSSALVPGVSNSWATVGQRFTAEMEIRGFGPGLNLREENLGGYNLKVVGRWISDPDFTEAETNAFAKFAGLDMTAENFAEQFEAAIRTSSWTPENRTDPTVADTDGDGFPDGYEYYFWYAATVGWMETDTDGNRVHKQMTGSKFTLKNIAQGDVITSEEIAAAFNPTVSAGTSAYLTRDVDNDGLTDLEELAIGTNPIHWDSDNDGMSDLWEIMNGLNPLEKDADKNADGDFMASVLLPEGDLGSAEATDLWAIVTVPGAKGGIYAAPMNGAALVLDADGNLDVAETPSFGAVKVFRYGNDTDVCVPVNAGGKNSKPLDLAQVDVSAVTDPITVEVGQAIRLIHDQVYNQYGFDPRTAWAKDSSGYVSSRWNVSGTHAKYEGEAGKAINTVPYTARDEYLLLKYRYQVAPAKTKDNPSDSSDTTYNVNRDLANVASKKVTLGDVLHMGTTCPSNPFTNTYGTGEYQKIFASEVYGADTDGDGVPDGWELYVGHNPNFAGPADTGDSDKDNLSLAMEYAGTDACNAYNNVPTIITNHPGVVSGWYNKFFPTDPANADTDGDGIKDGDEGASWSGTFILENSGSSDPLPHMYTFIYGPNNGKPEGDDGSLCIRGGGLNPCSVDTDGDLLPDPWERQFAGVVFNANASPDRIELDPATLAIIRRNDNIGTNALGYYITAGMDGTHGPRLDNMTQTGDAWTNPGYTDPRTGTKRDFDFDHDGLQNFQEYLVQSLRHLRYDDSETPLMGRCLLDGTPKFVKFLPMQVWDGKAFAQTALEAGFTGIAGEGFKFRELGYFARPPHAWDRMAQNTQGQKLCANYEDPGYRLMLPPQGLSAAASATSEARMAAAGYVSTDPRKWDSDGDGMDDYYEVFHGLNPLLGVGSAAGTDVIANQYMLNMDQCSYSFNAWTGWPMLPIEPAFDAMAYPWVIGMPLCDADGDGLRNMDEMLLANMPNPLNYHTDPTPLWMTDPTSVESASFTAQYYFMDRYMAENGVAPDLLKYPWWGLAPGGTALYMFPFEENEGYDTDHDNNPDSVEISRTINPASDPLKFTDPDRRQALWLSGDRSAAVSYGGANSRGTDSKDWSMFRQFTVEAWICPEDVARDQVILERSSEYSASTLSNAAPAYIRANFRLGIAEDGRLYGLYDSSDALASGATPSSPTAYGPKLTADTWAHVALTYDGKTLRLFLNGSVVGTCESGLIPANGVIAVNQSVTTASGGAFVGTYEALPAALVLGACAIDSSAWQIGAQAYLSGIAATWNSYGAFYKGWIDEVRVWDGACTGPEIAASYKTRLTFEDALTNRLEVYTAWLNNATRNNNDGQETLPPELILHYNFQTLPSDVNADAVAREPAGFKKNVLDNVRSLDGRPMDSLLVCGWWDRLPVTSVVYDNHTWVPWIPNTCAHLPALDGSTPDSQYWSEPLAGTTFADEAGVNAFLFPNSANPYPYWNYLGEPIYRNNRLVSLCEVGTNISETAAARAYDVYKRYDFQRKKAFLGSTDLLPLGDAFAKRTDRMWDGNGASEAWSSTATDSDGNGFPDWWEAYARENYALTGDVTVDTLVVRDGVEMTAGEAYLRDLAAGMLPGGVLTDDDGKTYKATADADGDGLPDWWENLYGIAAASGMDDSDDDQLSNYAEYLIGEGFLHYGFPFVSPTSMRTKSGDGQQLSDYFLTVGNLYLGEMFSDHDFMEDFWEDRYSPSFVTRGLYDPWDDPDDDGWSNYAECRAATDPTRESLPGLVDVEEDVAYSLPEYPVPNINVTVSYNGAATLDAPVYVQAYSVMDSIPDAVWSIGVNGNTERYLGFNPQHPVSLTMGPGSVGPGSVSVIFKSVIWFDSDGVQHSIEDSTWVDPVKDLMRTDDSTMGDLVYRTTGEKVGQVNYVTGEVTIDLSKCAGDYRVVDSESSGDKGPSVYSLGKSYVKVVARSVIPVGTHKLTLGLQNADPAVIGISKGHVREGRNTFVAFMDTNKDGVWTPGEPYGVAAGVDVGWFGAACDIELTDTVTQMTRINLRDAVAATEFAAANALTDRGVTGLGAPNVACEYLGTNMPAATVSTRVRVVRNWINGAAGVSTSASYARVVLDKVFNLTEHPFLTEADLLADGNVDLDFGTIYPDFYAAHGGRGTVDQITEATYRIVLGDKDPTSYENFGNNLPLQFTTRFEAKTAPTPVTYVAPLGGIVVAGSPTFKWTHTNAIDKVYPGFQLRIWQKAANGTAGSLVYDSGVRRMPMRDSSGVYAWTAPVYPGMVTPQGFVFETTNNYLWAVSPIDAKFSAFLSSAPKESFRLSTTGNKTDGNGYGSLQVAARYFGALSADVSTTERVNMIHVQAFTTPDFVGRPVSEAFVTNTAALADIFDGTTVNAVLRGLPVNATYYVRAFLDTDGNGEKAQWETWGYANYVGRDDLAHDSTAFTDLTRKTLPSAYTPRGFTVSVNGAAETALVCLEDTDTDNDGFPDAWEMFTKGSLSAQGSVSGNTFFAKVNPELADELAAFDHLGLLDSTGSSSGYLRLMSALLSGSGSESIMAATLLNQSVGSTEASARITSFSPSAGAGVELVTETTVTGGSRTGLSLFSVTPPEVITVRWRLWYAPKMGETWTEVSDGLVTASGTDVENITVDAVGAARASDKYSETSGFFKVTVEPAE